MSDDGTRAVAFLRGINLGGRRLSNADLCAAFARAGFDDAEAFRAAGNVAFTSEDPEERLVERIETGLAAELGYEVRALVRTGEELTAIAGFEPFTPDQLAASKGKLQVCLLSRSLDAPQSAEVEAKATVDDLLVVGEREIYWLPAGGVSDSKLLWDALVPGGALQTMRTMGTIEGLVQKFVAA